MALEERRNGIGRETEWRWKRDRIAVEGSWAVVGRLAGDESACTITIIFYGIYPEFVGAVVVGVRGNDDFRQKCQKIYTECKGIHTDFYMIIAFNK